MGDIRVVGWDQLNSYSNQYWRLLVDAGTSTKAVPMGEGDYIKSSGLLMDLRNKGQE